MILKKDKIKKKNMKIHWIVAEHRGNTDIKLTIYIRSVLEEEVPTAK